jgi:ATPase subunit of ABC transporter with duplicated ATPase domains
VSGEQWLGPGVVVGELDQARGHFAGDTPLLAAFEAAVGRPLRPSEARSALAKFGLGSGHVDRPCRTLSPGERTRAVLATLMARGVNCLVLDEPTNHLDLPAIEQLEQALDTWEGTLLLVTHDRRLLDHVRIDTTIQLAATS